MNRHGKWQGTELYASATEKGLTWSRSDVVNKFPVNIKGAKSLGMTDRSFSASAWVFRAKSAGSGDHTVFGTDETSGGKGLHLIVRGNKYYIGFYGNDCGSRAVSNKDKWEHVVYVYDKPSKTQRIYANGVEAGKCTNKASFKGTGMVRIGQWAKGRKWVGSIKDARIFNRALSAAEVRGAYGAPSVTGLTYSRNEATTKFPTNIMNADKLGIYDASFTGMAYVNRAKNAGSGDHSVFGTDQTSGGKGLHLIVRGNRYYIGFYGNDCGSSGTSNKGVWEHIAFVYHKPSKSQIMYLNGKQVGKCGGKASFKGKGMVNIGQWAGGRKWVGKIQDVKFYNRALNSREIAMSTLGTSAYFDGRSKIMVNSFKNFVWKNKLSVSLWFRRMGRSGYQGIVNNGEPVSHFSLLATSSQ